MKNSSANPSQKYPINNSEKNKYPLGLLPQKTNKWNFLLPLLFQLGLLAFLSSTAIHTYLTGKTVILQTAPVDPYSLLRGYHQILNYEISQVRNLENIEGWEELKNKKCLNMKRCSNFEQLPKGTKIYLVLQPLNKQNNKQNKNKYVNSSQPWQPVRVTDKYPQNLQSSEVVIKGKYQNGRIKYGLENYYIPETEKEQMNKNINLAQRNVNETNKIPFLVEIKVNNNGQAIPISLWINENKYRF